MAPDNMEYKRTAIHEERLAHMRRLALVRAYTQVLDKKKAENPGRDVGIAPTFVKEDYLALKKLLLTTHPELGDATDVLTVDDKKKLIRKKEKLIELYKVYRRLHDVTGIKFEPPRYALDKTMPQSQRDQLAELFKKEAKNGQMTHTEGWKVFQKRKNNEDLEMLRRYERGIRVLDTPPKPPAISRIPLIPASVSSIPKEPTPQPEPPVKRAEVESYKEVDDLLTARLADLVPALNNVLKDDPTRDQKLMALFGPQSKFTGGEVVKRLYHLISVPSLLRAHLQEMLEDEEEFYDAAEEESRRELQFQTRIEGTFSGLSPPDQSSEMVYGTALPSMNGIMGR